jgi:hypothetical protein
MSEGSCNGNVEGLQADAVTFEKPECLRDDSEPLQTLSSAAAAESLSSSESSSHDPNERSYSLQSLPFDGALPTSASFASETDDDPQPVEAPRRPLLRHLPNVKRYIRVPCPTFRLLRLIFVYSLVLFAFFVLIMWFGMLYEDAQVRNGPDTRAFYQTPKICAVENITTTAANAGGNKTTTTKLIVKTLDSVDQVNTTTDIVAHCGDCGSCSSPHDIRIYDATKSTLTEDAMTCAKRGIFGGRKAIQQCLQERVGFTAPCNECWVENIICDRRKCVFTCIIQGIFSKGLHTGSDNEELNRCTKCDEVRCGPQFISCAGANRRRSGILSDIERDVNAEVCQKVNPKEWWNDEALQQAWEKQQQNDTAAP